MSEVVIQGHGFDPRRADRAFRSAAREQMGKAMSAVHRVTVERAPFRTGHLRRSITYTVLDHGNQLVGVIGTTTRYAPFLEMGTGLYGPRNRRIVPVNARALRFPAGGSASTFSGGSRTSGSAGPGFRLSGQQRSGRAGAGANFVFCRSVRGIHPLHFFRDAQLIARGQAAAQIRMIGPVARAKLEKP